MILSIIDKVIIFKDDVLFTNLVVPLIKKISTCFFRENVIIKVSGSSKKSTNANKTNHNNEFCEITTCTEPTLCKAKGRPSLVFILRDVTRFTPSLARLVQ